jgi:hypothetical protein
MPAYASHVIQDVLKNSKNVVRIASNETLLFIGKKK